MISVQKFVPPCISLKILICLWFICLFAHLLVWLFACLVTKPDFFMRTWREMQTFALCFRRTTSCKVDCSVWLSTAHSLITQDCTNYIFPSCSFLVWCFSAKTSPSSCSSVKTPWVRIGLPDTRGVCGVQVLVKKTNKKNIPIQIWNEFSAVFKHTFTHTHARFSVMARTLLWQNNNNCTAWHCRNKCYVTPESPKVWNQLRLQGALCGVDLERAIYV